MGWWNPREWFNKKTLADVEILPTPEINTERWVGEEAAPLATAEPSFEPAPQPPSPPPPPAPPAAPIDRPFVWVRLNPAMAHQGFDQYSSTPNNPFPCALLVTGIGSDEARIQLVGKVLDWSLLTAAQIADLEAHTALTLDYATLKGMFR